MMRKKVFGFIVLVFFAAAYNSFANSENLSDLIKSSNYSKIPLDFVKDFIVQIKKYERVPTSDSLEKIIFYSYDKKSPYSEILIKSVESINSALGDNRYSAKIANHNDFFDAQAICLYLGKGWQIERFFRSADPYINHPKTNYKRPWTTYSFWGYNKIITSALVGVNIDQVKGDKCVEYFMLRSLLQILGYSGDFDDAVKKVKINNTIYVMDIQSIFNISNDFTCAKQLSCSHHVTQLTDWDKCVLLFCDKYLSTVKTPNDIKKIIDENWGLFALNYELQLK